MRRWLGPSLLRRTVLTLLAALLLVWVVLSMKDYWDFKRDVQGSESLGRMTQTVLDSLQGFDAVQALSAMRAADRQFNELRLRAQPKAPDTLLFQLSQTDGALVYRSEGAGDLPDLPAGAGHKQVDHQGRSYWPVVRESAHWRLAVWVPVLPDRLALTLIGQDILSYLLLALPFVVLPMALAVWLGLRPLRVLVRQIAQRPSGDLSPLQEPTGYAELAPLVDAGNALLERARGQREAEQAFVQDAAHELKTPLAVVAAQAHVLAAAQDDEQRHAALQALERGVQRASHQVNQLLTLAALDHAAPRPARPVDLVEMTREILIELEPVARRRGVALSLLSPERLLDPLDAESLRLVLVNLVHNAIQHGSEGGAVQVLLDRNQGTVALQVSDDGPGIAAHERARVFDRFYRAETARSAGSGLGLAIVLRAAQRLHASVEYADTPGRGGASLELRWMAGSTD